MLHEYHVIYSVRYYPRFHVTAVGLESITSRYGGTTVYGNLADVFPLTESGRLIFQIFFDCICTS
jgi:hypothetical protein